MGFAVIAPSCGTFSNLKNFSVTECPKVKSLFTSILLLLFRTLEVIIAWECAQIKEIIEKVHEDGLETSFFSNHDDDNLDIPLITLSKLKENFSSTDKSLKLLLCAWKRIHKYFSLSPHNVELLYCSFFISFPLCEVFLNHLSSICSSPTPINIQKLQK